MIARDAKFMMREIPRPTSPVTLFNGHLSRYTVEGIFRAGLQITFFRAAGSVQVAPEETPL
jgi:hypothetical protein